MPWLLHLASPLTSGAMSVHIFFVISGFVMGIIPAQRGLAGALHFLRKRLVRIAPMYWLCTLIAAALSGAALDAPTLARSMLFIPPDGYFPILGVAWSSNFEMFFYLTIFAGLLTIGRNVWFPICMVVAAAVLHQTTGLLPVIGNPIVLEFAAGLLASRLYTNLGIIRCSSAQIAAGIAGVTASAFLYAAPEAWAAGTLPWWGPPSFLLVLGCAAKEAGGGKTVLSTSVLQELGAASYALYLTHTLLFSANWHLMQSMQLAEILPADLCVVALVLVSIALGVMVHHLVEKPLLAVLNRAHSLSSRISAGPQTLGP